MGARIETTCCIAGGGPAGMMLGFLLARAGVEVVVLEKHADFLRDFRGDTIHPSTLELMSELGLLEEFLRRPHQEMPRVEGEINGTHVVIADFSALGTRCKYIALMPQWDFLTFIAGQAKRYPGFHLLMEAEVTGLLSAAGRVTGVEAHTPRGSLAVEADLVIGADGRGSTVRARSGLQVEDRGAPIDVLWMRLSKKTSDPGSTFGRVSAGKFLVTLDRGDYWQCAYVIPKGGIERMRSRGLAAFRSDIGGIAPFLADRVDELGSWDDVKLLTVKVDRLVRWYRPGLMCIGDAAHAMSPVGGVGINLAIQDAVAAANILAERLRARSVTWADLDAVQHRRELPTDLIQRIQIGIQDRLLAPAISSPKGVRTPLLFRALKLWPWLRRIPARLVGVGFRPEHINTRAV